MASHPQAYYDAPLDQSTSSIRLLRLEKRDNSSVSCTLSTFQISQCPPFVALSYTWGSPHPTYEIVVNGQPFPVRENLWSAIYTICELLPSEGGACSWCSKPRVPKYVWIDAICINQEDLLERGHQVNMMKDIFSTADFVIAWLGSQSEESRQILDEIPGFKPHSDTAWRKWSIKASKGVRKLFFDRLYWERMWIVQEFVLARDVYFLCGPQGVWWNEFKDYLETLVYMEGHSEALIALGISSGAAALHHHRIQRKHCSGVLLAATLDWLIEKFHSGRCVDARDRVFALIGLINVSDTSSTVPIADYTITSTQLYYRTLSYVRHSIRLRETAIWTNFRETLASALEISLDDRYYSAELIYQAAEEDRPLQKPTLSQHPDSREILMARFLAFLKENLRGRLEMEGVDSWRLYHQVVAYFDSFPRQDDPEAWQCFESMLKEALKIAPINDIDIFTAYIEFSGTD